MENAAGKTPIIGHPIRKCGGAALLYFQVSIGSGLAVVIGKVPESEDVAKNRMVTAQNRQIWLQVDPMRMEWV